MARRLEVARRELLEAHRYRYRVVNEDVDEAVGTVQGILAAEGFGPASVAASDTAATTTTRPGVSA